MPGLFFVPGFVFEPVFFSSLGIPPQATVLNLFPSAINDVLVALLITLMVRAGANSLVWLPTFTFFYAPRWPECGQAPLRMLLSGLQSL